MSEGTSLMGAAVKRTNRRRILRALLTGAAALALLTFLSGCTGSSGGESAASGSDVNVTLHDFKIDPMVTKAKDGRVTFRIHNDAPMTHEFVVARSNLASGHLPIGPDGLSIDEDKLQAIGELSDVRSGTIDSLHLNLPPGHYVYFCNLEGHYLGGMHGALTVSGHA
jgi:uncharacterized cupredoxin-like copper-binding protein